MNLSQQREVMMNQQRLRGLSVAALFTDGVELV
jgi:hypothetical protein